MPHLNEQQKLYLKQLLLVLGLLTLSITLSIGLIIGTYLIKPDRLLSLPYIPHKKNCTAYLAEFITHRTLSSKSSQLSKTLNCLEQFQYPLNQEYIDLKNNFRQLNANPTIDQFLEISH
ncbi:hypothetical protein [Chroococcus sp. FPU101]|uniref:hypothetical protein n=1 Tax=Chroococcus sp. FPU101 TaxID=1974212 RepID=UPI001A8CEF89|nr:hypothetical protein [Chroococcus sp. FPU101]GFE69065.1 hypothetical protein CFPU101_16750 [Chroococcus sp. FPU101]